MSDYNIYQEIFDTHQIFFEQYLKHFSSPFSNILKFANWRLSYINYLTDVILNNNYNI